MYLEGGPEAQLWINPAAVPPDAGAAFNRSFNPNGGNVLHLSVPNVLGIRPRSGANSEQFPD